MFEDGAFFPAHIPVVEDELGCDAAFFGGGCEWGVAEVLEGGDEFFCVGRRNGGAETERSEVGNAEFVAGVHIFGKVGVANGSAEAFAKVV